MSDMDLGIVGLAQAMNQARLEQQHATAVLRLANKAAREEGEAAVRLLESVPGAVPAEGGAQSRIDVHA